ncbi:carbohydrate esterase family 5 protein [Annulohypoxylon maeteangense]|uniref:carbohydrate esterase family 5 protein n=1 Tax=Annulohypoxylon maeteangense TaxID=1927788 RepID=UPI00200860B3|nr:carbohydrate esterase family 5 protein [Annulohypoxylon maeteangense]KAI0880914.1 carbohydrate esterase family 5 protein [Annulohypoxylon maeteangense]
MNAIPRWVVLSGLTTSFYLSLISPASAAIIQSRDPAVSANDWDPVLNGDSGAGCADLAVIFARGTFDDGNIGPWVGSLFHDALVSHSSGIKIAMQGVSASDYPADLAGYVKEGGSNSCAKSLGSAVQKYNSHCPNSKVAIWGWSQGALCAHKSLSELGNAADSVIALGVFGDPVGIWQDTVNYPAIPSNTKLLSYCEQTTPDPLCTSVTEDFPSNPIEFINRLVAIWKQVDSTHMNDSQKAALTSLITELPKQAKSQISQLGKDIVSGHLRRWMLTPEHFWYGNDGTVKTAVGDLISVYQSKK